MDKTLWVSSTGISLNLVPSLDKSQLSKPPKEAAIVRQFSGLREVADRVYRVNDGRR